MLLSIRKNIPLIAFGAYFVKSLILQPTLVEAAILLILGGVAGFFEYKSNDKKILDLNERLNNQQKSLDEKQKEIDSIKNSIMGIKLSGGMRAMK
jgi:peptidoglycan hydrolase CwlO-like protein